MSEPDLDDLWIDVSSCPDMGSLLLPLDLVPRFVHVREHVAAGCGAYLGGCQIKDELRCPVLG